MSGYPLCALLWCVALSASAGSPPKEDVSWKNYYNNQGEYCVDYLSRWVSGDAFEGAGFFLKPAPNRHSSSLAEIDVAVLRDRPAPAVLGEEVQLHLDNLRRFELAEHTELIEQHETQLYGNPALFAKDTYYDPQNHALMIDELILAEHAGLLYRLEFSSRADEVTRVEPLFQHLIASFRFECPPHPVPHDFAKSSTRRDRPEPITRPAITYPHSMAN